MSETNSNDKEISVLLSGEIAKGFIFDNYSSVKLIQDNGYKVDLISRFAEIVDSFGYKLSVRYWITDTKASFSDAVEGNIKQLLGGTVSELEANSYSYSEYTSGVEYDSDLKIGGHDLLKELEGQSGKWLWIMIEPTDM